MAERIKKYLAYVDAMLVNPPEDVDFEEEARKHLVQIAFFAHERLIHLIVTVVFAILSVGTFLYVIANPQPMLFLLLVAFMILMIPYIKHYYLLENSVQKMYDQYDALCKCAGIRGFSM